MHGLAYQIAVHGVPFSYYGSDPRADAPEEMSDEEWCEANDLDHNDLLRVSE